MHIKAKPIYVRFLENLEDGATVLKKDEQHEDGYYEFLIDKSILADIVNSNSPKDELFYVLVTLPNRHFLEFLMLELSIYSGKLVSVCFDYEDMEYEFSYFEGEYFEDTSLDDIKGFYDEEIGMMSDFDYYPYGFIQE